MPLHGSHTNELLATNATYRYHFGLGRSFNWTYIYSFRGGWQVSSLMLCHDLTTFHHILPAKKEKKTSMALKKTFSDAVKVGWENYVLCRWLEFNELSALEPRCVEGTHEPSWYRRLKKSVQRQSACCSGESEKQRKTEGQS